MSIHPRRCLTAAILLAGLAGRPAWAWNAAGHEQIADIAWTRLNRHARQRVSAILQAADPAFRPHVTSAEAFRAAFRRAATMPDVIKSDHGTIWEDRVDRENAAFPIAPNTKPSEAVRCKTWHYYDVPIRLGAHPRPPLDPSNGQAALTRAIAQLKAARDGATESWYLCWVEHLVGDLHQPLHCVSSYEFNPEGDAGGNGFKLGVQENGRPLSLHALWDAGIDSAVREDALSGVQAVSTAWIARNRPAAGAVRDHQPKDWIAAGAVLADHAAYAGLKPGDLASVAYTRAMNDLCRKQAVLAGFRLADILNGALGKQAASSPGRLPKAAVFRADSRPRVPATGRHQGDVGSRSRSLTD